MCLKLKKLCVHTFDLFYEVWHLSLQPPYSSEVTLLSPWKTGCQPSHVTALHSSQSLPVWSPSSTKIRVCWDILEGDCPALTLHVSWAPNTSLIFNHCVGLQFLLWNLCRVKLKKGGGGETWQTCISESANIANSCSNCESLLQCVCRSNDFLIRWPYLSSLVVIIGYKNISLLLLPVSWALKMTGSVLCRD